MDQAGDDDSNFVGNPTLEDVRDNELDFILLSTGRARQERSYPLINLSWSKAYTYEDLLQQTIAACAGHPASYVRTLIQLGYEPLPGKVNRSIFGRSKLYFPNFITYMSYIVGKDGWTGMFRGLRFSVVYSISYEFIYKNALNLQTKIDLFEPMLKDPETLFDSAPNLMLALASDMLPRLVALGVAYPFRVMAIRCMAQFVGGESTYDSFLDAVSDLYQCGGLSVFYAGFMPFLLADCLVTYTRWLVFYLVRDKWTISVRKMTNLLTAHSASYLAYSLQVASTVMTCNGPSARLLQASSCTNPAFDTWVQCVKVLWKRGQHRRGYSLFWRSSPLNLVDTQ